MAGALGSVSSPLRKVLQSDAESTPVLPAKYWSTLRTGLATGPVITNHTKRSGPQKPLKDFGARAIKWRSTLPIFNTLCEKN